MANCLLSSILLALYTAPNPPFPICSNNLNNFLGFPLEISSSDILSRDSLCIALLFTLLWCPFSIFFPVYFPHHITTPPHPPYLFSIFYCSGHYLPFLLQSEENRQSSLDNWRKKVEGMGRDTEEGRGRGKGYRRREKERGGGNGKGYRRREKE